MSRYLRLCLTIRTIRSRLIPHQSPPGPLGGARAAHRLAHPVVVAMVAMVAMALIAQVVLVAPLAHASAASSASAASVPQLDHVFTIVMENHTYGEIIGDTTDAPYINNTLIPSGALATNYDAITHPSLPNYIALTAGDTLGISTDCDPSSCSVSGPTIAGAALAAGKTWKAYEESMPSNCAQSNSGEYAVRHNPFAYFTNLPSCATNDVPYSQLSSDLSSASKTPSYAFITPNLIHDMHDGTIAQGDAWLKANVPAILNSPAFTQQRSLLAITWDEDDNNDVPNQVVTIFLGYGITPGTQNGTAYTHYGMLKTTEQALGLGSLTSNDTSATPMAAMFSASSPASTPSASPTATATTPPTATPSPTATSTASPTPPTATPSTPPAGALFADNFQTDTPGAAPASWSAENGSWTVQQDGTLSGGLPNAVLAQGNPSTASDYTITAGSPGWTNYTVQATVKPGANDLTQTTDLMARFTDDNNHYSFLLKNHSEWYLGKRAGGAWTTLAQGTFSYTSQFYQLALTVNGATISGAINGQVVASVTDTALTSGKVAFLTSAESELDNVVVAAPGSASLSSAPSGGGSSGSGGASAPTATGVDCVEVVNGQLTTGTCGGTFTPLLASVLGAASDGVLCVEQQNGALAIGKCSGAFTAKP